MVDDIFDTKVVRGRVEIRNGVGQRRRWSGEEKGRIVAEALRAETSMADVARRHELTPQHLFNWIRAAKNGHFALPADAAFVPVIAAAPDGPAAPMAAASSPRRQSAVAIEIVVQDMVVRAAPGIDICFLAEVLRAVRMST